MRHLKIVFKNIDHSLIQRLKENQEILDQHSESSDVEIVFKIVIVELGLRQQAGAGDYNL